jgi:hypothetical protein
LLLIPVLAAINSKHTFFQHHKSDETTLSQSRKAPQTPAHNIAVGK